MAKNKITAIKVKIKNNVATAKMVFSHPMMTYNQAKTKTGNSDDANFITHITGKVGKETVLDISTSQFFSKNPIFKFKFKSDTFKVGRKLSGRELDNGATRKESEKGDLLTVTAVDRKGNIYTKSVELAARKKR
ncbi:MAG: thiosulfate oxidation carrier complex protein SoxZ [Epsilonproteobacteria bacterium]|nr:MAG: thiosulfate oxidation carrier complex protein SoxZ [Campylobacterota bacterium]